MRLLFVFLLVVSLLLGCSSKANPESPTAFNQASQENSNKQEAERLLQKDTERNPTPAVSNSTPEPPKINYNSAFDIPLEKWEDDSIYTHRTKITEIEMVNQEDLENSIIGGMKMAAILKFEPRGLAGIREIESVYLSESGTHVFHRISDHEKQLATLADLKVGQEIEVQYCYPITPVFLAIEVLIVNETDK